MKSWFWKSVLPATLSLLLFASCNGLKYVETPEALAALDASTLLEMGAEAYVDNNYDVAEYYYRQILELFPDSSDEVAWATYELGWLEYVDGKKKDALSYFNSVLLIESDSIAPQYLAAEMISKLSGDESAEEGIELEESEDDLSGMDELFDPSLGIVE